METDRLYCTEENFSVRHVQILLILLKIKLVKAKYCMMTDHFIIFYHWIHYVCNPRLLNSPTTSLFSLRGS